MIFYRHIAIGKHTMGLQSLSRRAVPSLRSNRSQPLHSSCHTQNPQIMSQNPKTSIWGHTRRNPSGLVTFSSITGPAQTSSSPPHAQDSGPSASLRRMKVNFCRWVC